jgi:hypothetical protein
VKRLGLLALMVAGAAWLPGSAEAATCADYSNQAAAQQAADTRDADGDGIYCESLPCPCPTGAGGRSASVSRQAEADHQAKARFHQPHWILVDQVPQHPSARAGGYQGRLARVLVVNRNGVDAPS